MGYYEDFIAMIDGGQITSRQDVLRAKALLCRRYGLSRVPTNHEILERVPSELRDVAEPLLRNKPVRTISGVAPVAVMTSPSECPHGRCSYCPGGVENGSPQSYTGREPAALRGAMYEFDPYDQTSARLSQLNAIGHRTDKVDLIVMGGTFTSRPPEYQEWFVRRCFDAMNGFDSTDLESAHAANESADRRCVGLTVETRPDWFRKEHVDESMRLGATKVELGVQILDDGILEGVRRGHGVDDTAAATSIAREAGLKVCYHVMPGLPGSDHDNDMRSFRSMFSDERFRPDMIKIYPTLVIKGTELYGLWREGGYAPPSLDEVVALVSDMKRAVPPWVRILRVQRDIPVQLIEAGVRKSHLREIVAKALKDRGEVCGCIRCREVGHRELRGEPSEASGLELTETSYRAARGIEKFIHFSILESGALAAYARLRCPSGEGRTAACVRELHVCGQMVPLDEGPKGRWQHGGLGGRLLGRCEEVAGDMGFDAIRVTSGVGARNYYRRLGYQRSGVYMSKVLDG